MIECDSCVYNNYDEEMDSYVCDAVVDEDEVARMAMRGQNKACPYYRNYDEYQLVKHQM